MKLLLVGGTGFLGRRVAARLSERLGTDSDRVALTREPDRAEHLSALGFQVRRGDLSDEASLREVLGDRDTLVTTTTLKLGHTPTLFRALEGSPVSRGVFVSTTGIFTDLELPERTRVLEAEDLIRNSGVPFTILRPTMIYGAADDINIHKMLRFADRWGFFPVLGDAGCLQHPVHVDDVADAVVNALLADAARNRTYNLSGKAPIRFDAMIDEVGNALGRSVLRPRLPLSVSLAAAQLLRVLPRPPFTPGQIRRNNMDKSVDHADAARDLGYCPIDFPTGVRRQVAEMKQQGLL
jgi:uncharacterized protein YbjT (DUF2867 family)